MLPISKAMGYNRLPWQKQSGEGEKRKNGQWSSCCQDAWGGGRGRTTAAVLVILYHCGGESEELRGRSATAALVFLPG